MNTAGALPKPVAMAFQPDTLRLDFRGDARLGSVLDHGKSTMLVTVWVFIVIEGARVYLARARSQTNHERRWIWTQ